MTPKTIDDFTQELKAEYPTLSKSIDDQSVTLSSGEYTSTISEWASIKLAEQNKALADITQAEQAATDKAALLEQLGITADQAKLLLS